MRTDGWARVRTFIADMDIELGKYLFKVIS